MVVTVDDLIYQLEEFRSTHGGDCVIALEDHEAGEFYRPSRILLDERRILDSGYGRTGKTLMYVKVAVMSFHDEWELIRRRKNASNDGH